MAEANFDPTNLISECRDIGNYHFAQQDYSKAEEAFTLGWTMYEMYPSEPAKTAGFGCLVGLADALRAQDRQFEAEEVIRSSRERRRHAA